jgi:hypothetical protein
VPEHPELAELNRRLKPLMHELRGSPNPCPFIANGEAVKRIALAHYSAGHDATYVHVSRKWDGRLPLDELAAAIIYDLTSETMQGQARPFVCDLGRRLARSYMILPFQLESISVRAMGPAKTCQLHVAFLDARGQTVEAALPFELRLIDPTGEETRKECYATSRLGQFARRLDGLGVAPAPGFHVVVRSLLTGQAESLALHAA